MPPKRAALLRQRDKSGQSVYRLRAGATGSRAVLASSPAALSADEAIAAAQALVRSRAWRLSSGVLGWCGGCRSGWWMRL